MYLWKEAWGGGCILGDLRAAAQMRARGGEDPRSCLDGMMESSTQVARNVCAKNSSCTGGRRL